VGPELAPNPWFVLPFVALLLAIALGPLLAPGAWQRHYPKISIVLACITLGYYLFGLHANSRVLEIAHDYVSFIALIGSLFVVSGGIHISVKGQASPHMNVVYLLIGALAANFLGTTGASMLLIRPWIRMNKYRITGYHIVFFIFIVSNAGGCLTPIGDPPLFLGYLRGVPFWWVTKTCWPMWLLAMGFLLALFYLIDSKNYRRAPRSVRADLTGEPEKWRLEGLWNILFLGVILSAVFVNRPIFVREILMAGAAVCSWFTTRKNIYQSNYFTFHPFQEVSILFFGIFATMLPALDLVQMNAHAFGPPIPGKFYWGCGLLSSVLDNAPTYLTFLTAGVGSVASLGTKVEFQQGLKALLQDPNGVRCLTAISISSVFFGALTYIGNAPNFMVKSIAETHKIPTPGFGGFVFKYSLPCLGSLLVIVWLVFFR
jgi:Na+/H+ antiporter NhaD/arsenite permease-like protein